MSVRPETTSQRAEEAEVLTAVRGGDAPAFAALAERYRRQLQVHCYRMLGSFDDAEDLVQETLLRAWRGRAEFEGRSMFRTWLYRIATNACLNALERLPRRVMPQDVAPPVTAATDMSEARSEPPWAPELPWLQPCPDHVLEPAAPPESQPDSAIVSRETIGLTYLAALQHLPPRQRAALILGDALGWSATEIAGLLDTTVASVNSALQRARDTMRARLTAGTRDPTPPTTAPTDEERALLQRFMAAWEQPDTNALVALLREDVRWAMPPAPLWFHGRAAVARLFQAFPPGRLGAFRMMATAANRQPAAAAYIRAPGAAAFRLVSLTVLEIEGGAIAAMTTFNPALLRPFQLPHELR